MLTGGQDSDFRRTRREEPGGDGAGSPLAGQASGRGSNGTGGRLQGWADPSRSGHLRHLLCSQHKGAARARSGGGETWRAPLLDRTLPQTRKQVTRLELQGRGRPICKSEQDPGRTGGRKRKRWHRAPRVRGAPGTGHLPLSHRHLV